MTKGLEALEKELNLMQQQKDNLLHKQARAKTDNEIKYWQFRIDKFNEKISAFTNIKQALLKAQEQEKVLEIIKKKNINVFLLKRADDLFYYNANNGLRGYPIETEEEFDLLKRYYNEEK